MSIITVSRGSYSHGREIAERFAQVLNYECISREILIEASQEFNISEIKLYHAVHDAPTLIDLISLNKDRYIIFFESAILKHLKKDNVVYHGLAGHFFLKDIAHVLKVRIIADMEERIKLIRERNGGTIKEASRYIKKIDEQRRKWSQHLYGIETSNPSLYDIVMNVSQVPV